MPAIVGACFKSPPRLASKECAALRYPHGLTPGKRLSTVTRIGQAVRQARTWFDLRSTELMSASSTLSSPRSGNATTETWRAIAAIFLVAGLLFGIRLAGPPNLLDQDQENPATYVLDALKNGNWLCQRDLAGNISSKPPVYTWLAALPSWLTGRVSLFTLYLPGALALFGSASLVFLLGRSQFTPRAGFLGAMGCLICTAGMKELGLARTDGVFAFSVTCGAFLAYHVWTERRSWTGFWLVAAMGTLTKGPLALLLSAAGLLAVFWERGSEERRPLKGSHLRGVMLYLLLTGGWLALACWQLGYPVLDRLILRELLFHAVEGENKKLPGSLIYLSPLYYLARAAPWSVFAYYGLWRIYRTPSADLGARRLERFLFCWFGAGLLLFSMSPHQRGDLLWPIMPAAALIAGREIDRLLDRWPKTAGNRWIVGGLALSIVVFGFYFVGARVKNPMVRQTIATRELAREIERVGGREFPLSHTDNPPGLQVYLNTYRPPITLEQAAQLLAGSNPVFIAVNDTNRLTALCQSNNTPFFTLLDDHGPVGKLRTRIVSNSPRMAAPAAAALGVGPWSLRTSRRLNVVTDQFIAVSNAVSGDLLTVTHWGTESRSLKVTLEGLGNKRTLVRTLSPGDSWQIPSSP